MLFLHNGLASLLFLLLWSDFVPGTHFITTAKKHNKKKRGKHKHIEIDIDDGTPYVSNATTSKYLCTHIPMPERSHFTGMEPPTDAIKWSQAIEDTCAGKLILLEKVLEVTRNRSQDIYSGGVSHMWTHDIGDLHLQNGMSIKKSARDYYNSHSPNTRAPIIHLGDRKKKPDGSSGFKEFASKNLCEYKEKIPGEIVVIGCMDSNWGFLSTNLMNRSVYWKSHLGPAGRTKHLSSQELLQDFLDNPSLLMFVVSGHHNITHPKLVSMPLGPTDAHKCYSTAKMAIRENKERGNVYRKHTLLMTAGSNWKFRPAIRECVSLNMGKEMLLPKKRLSPKSFMTKIMESLAVLCMPGLGYDSYRIWETLLMGSMPVLERGCGMDRTFWKLPVLAVDDFASVTPALVHSAYVEALYRREEWEYRRLMKSFWKELLFTVAEQKRSQRLMDLFPMRAVDQGFTRPLFAFNCEQMGGCGPGTKRTPEHYCAIDRTIDYNKFTGFDRL
jgi:hypothetical protein